MSMKSDDNPLNVDRILAWADAHRKRTGRWPTLRSGPVNGVAGEDWGKIHAALQEGRRGLRRGSSLFKVLAKHRGKRMRSNVSKLTIAEILHWADQHKSRTGRWPSQLGGEVAGVDPPVKWSTIDAALSSGGRGLPGGSSLAKLLEQRRGRKHLLHLPKFTEQQILRWADDHHRRTGEWPTIRAGTVSAAPAETWEAVNEALRRGTRGMPGGSSLPRLLVSSGRKFRKATRSPLQVKQVLAWLDAYFARHGCWPGEEDGKIDGEGKLSWFTVHADLVRGRVLGTKARSVRELVLQERNSWTSTGKPRLTVELILKWADDHHRRTGTWPNTYSGTILAAPNETWVAIDGAMRIGGRGYDGGLSLAKLLAKHGRKEYPGFATTMWGWSARGGQRGGSGRRVHGRGPRDAGKAATSRDRNRVPKPDRAQPPRREPPLIEVMPAARRPVPARRSSRSAALGRIDWALPGW